MKLFQFAAVNRYGVIYGLFIDLRDALLFVKFYYEERDLGLYIVPFDPVKGVVAWGSEK